MSYVVRSRISSSELMPLVRRAADSVDPQLALAQVRTLQDVLDRASAQMAFTIVLLAIAASVALMLGVIGIHGVMSYVVTQRTGEIGVRLALGAEPASVSRMIVRQGGLVTVAGITIGLATALAGSRLIESLLYGVSPRDPRVFAITTVTLLAVALFSLLAARAAPHASTRLKRYAPTGGRSRTPRANSIRMRLARTSWRSHVSALCRYHPRSQTAVVEHSGLYSEKCKTLGKLAKL
jgi:predicted lysophospholipase L1 biosynthesis ABC-type transport system permease subunit